MTDESTMRVTYARAILDAIDALPGDGLDAPAVVEALVSIASGIAVKANAESTDPIPVQRIQGILVGVMKHYTEGLAAELHAPLDRSALN